MSVKREHSFTVRLSRDEKATLDALAKRLDLDKSATVRKALQLALHNKAALPNHGQFVPLNSDDIVFPVRLSGKGSHDR